MKKSLLCFSLLAILFSGCSKDDNSPQEETAIPASEKFLTDVTVSNDPNNKFTLKYNEANNVERLQIANHLLFTYSYQGNQLNSLDVYFSNNTTNYLFAYDANGRINSFTEDDVITTVTYNVSNNYYLYQKENGDEVTVFINANGDITKLVAYDKAADETQTTTAIYEGGNYNGTLTNTNNPILPTIVAFPAVFTVLLSYNLSKKPLQTLIAPQFGIINFENTFDDQDFVKTSTYTFGNNAPTTFTFNYIKL